MQKDSYLSFENCFRGDEKKIISNLAHYNALIDVLMRTDSNHVFVDVGCGRGEWLQKWQGKVDRAVGIEIDADMIALGRAKGLDIIEADVLTGLDQFKDKSVSLITIFHVIEHINHEKLSKLLSACYRVLNDYGVLIIETPSIDNILVSTNSFYVDSTHISHINADRVQFLLQTKGFDQSKLFYIHGGPLKNSNFTKLTRVLNGIAQDLLIVASKSKLQSENIFSFNTRWESSIDSGITTLQAAIDFDLKNEELIQEFNTFNNYTHRKIKDLNAVINSYQNNISELSLLKKQVVDLNAKLKYIIICFESIKKILRPFLILYRLVLTKLSKTVIIIVTRFLRVKFLRSIVFSSRSLHLIRSLIALLRIKSNFLNSFLESKLSKINSRDLTSSKFNNKLLDHYNYSSNANILFRKLHDKYIGN